ncbi:MAG: DUF1493 family protein [Verrucomicrobia bacterium]|nr:DUF1493 family protein [Verrucomicrobiota bacterium]
MSTPVTFDQVREFLCEQWRVRPERITPHTRLLHDLGIDADDAEEMLTAFAERFHVDFSSLCFANHFGSELDAGARWVVRKVFGSDAVGKSPITVQDLVDAASCGRWIEREKDKV